MICHPTVRVRASTLTECRSRYAAPSSGSPVKGGWGEKSLETENAFAWFRLFAQPTRSPAPIDGALFDYVPSLSHFVWVIGFLFQLYSLIPQIHHTVVVGFAFHELKRGFYGHRSQERFAITDYQGMDQHIDSVPQVIFQK